LSSDDFSNLYARKLNNIIALTLEIQFMPPLTGVLRHVLTVFSGNLENVILEGMPGKKQKKAGQKLTCKHMRRFYGE